MDQKIKIIKIFICDSDDQPEFDETDYLMANPANRKRLLDVVENICQGRSVEVDLDQLS